MTRSERKQLWRLLEQVSRSFYLTLSVLPGAIRQQIGLAYLLARATDTIADTHLVSIERRRTALHDLRAAILTAENCPSPLLNLDELAAAQPAPAGRGSPAEKTLLESVGKAIRILRTLPPADRGYIRAVLDTITSGQEMDLIRFGAASATQIQALNTDEELDDYTYRVAGCVGEFWTRMCRTHLFPQIQWDESFMLANGIRFGKGLQLVNVLRDVAADLRLGRCYIPRIRLEESGLNPQALLESVAFDRFRPLYTGYLQLAEDHLMAGWSYTNSLPKGQVRVKLACAWPILIGIRTLARLRTANILDGAQRIMISQSEVRRIILRTMLCYPRPAAFARLFFYAK